MSKRFVFDDKDTSKFDSKYPTPDIKDLFKAISELKDESEITDFFRDLLTPTEIEEFANRWKMAKLLYEGKPYLEVALLTNSSTTTVSRVAQWLFQGRGGYLAVLYRRNYKNMDKRLKDERIKKKLKRFLQKPSTLPHILADNLE